jgi:predicted DNA-binding transcriptional regulator AlpA
MQLMEFSEILQRAGLSRPDLAAEFLGVSRPTIYNYIRHGAPIMARRALEFRAGTNPDYYGLRFDRSGIWAESRRVIDRLDLVNIEWMIEQAYQRGRADGERQTAAVQRTRRTG